MGSDSAGRVRPLRAAVRARRISLAHTQFAATCGTIRLQLLKIGALARISVRRVTVAMASACPWQQEFALAHAMLRNAAARKARPRHRKPHKPPAIVPSEAMTH
jgi:hypothetical protein